MQPGLRDSTMPDTIDLSRQLRICDMGGASCCQIKVR